MKLKLLFITALISCSLYSQADTESIQLVYDTSGYLENIREPEGIVVDPGDQLATVIPTVNAEMNINEAGALTYTLPIEVLKGLNSFQPNLALIYNSQSGNGQAGYGWNISGTSMISQGGKSKEIDGITIGPQFDNTDPFYLDGQRLIKINDTEYVTEKFSKIRIQKYNSGEYSFIVKYTDGRIARYKEIVSGSGAYYISVIADAFDNEIHYSYNVDRNTPYLTVVSYGGTSTGTDKFFVNIYYKSKSHILKSYRNGIEYGNYKIIDYITTSSTYSDVGVYRQYKLAYDYIENGTTERLRSVNVFNGAGDALKPLNIGYNSPSSTGEINYVAKASNAIPAGTVSLGNVALGDFFGKGEIEPIYQIKDNFSKYYVYHNNGIINTAFGTNSYTSFYSGKALINNKITKNDQLISINTQYFGRDTLPETLIDRISIDIRDLVTGYNRQVVYNLKGTRSTDYNHDNYNGSGPNGGINSPPVQLKNEYDIISGDFNNDGLIDFLVRAQKGMDRNQQFYFAEIGKFGENTPLKLISGNINNFDSSDFYSLEFDGDGLPEIMAVNSGNSSYSIFKINLFDYSAREILNNQTLSNFAKETPLLFGDFNGDGLTDFITPHKVYKLEDGTSLGTLYHNIENESLIWNRYLSTGNSFIMNTENYTSSKIAFIQSNQNNVIKRTSFWQKLWSGKMDEYTHTEYCTNNIIVTDFNGDGRSDVIMVNKIGKIKYNTSGELKNADVQNLGNDLPYGISTFNSKIANRITYVQNVSANSFSGSTFGVLNSPYKSIENVRYSPLTLIAPTSALNQLNQYKSGVIMNDVLYNGYGSWVVNNDKFLEKQIQQVDNGSNVIQKVEYRSMAPSYTTSESPYYYNKEQSDKFEYPLYIHDTNAAIYLAHKIHTEFDGKILTKEYRFENGVQHLEGKGFIGFQKTYVSDAFESEIKDGKYVNKNPVRAVFWNISTKDPLKENAIITTTYGGLKDFFTVNRSKNDKFILGNQYLILSTEEESIDYQKKITINKRYFYDKEDDLKLKKAYTDYDGIGSTEESYTYAPESTNDDHYFYGQIASLEQTSYRDNLSFKKREENDYFPNGNLKENRKYSNNSSTPPIVANSTYDNVGNLKSQTLSTYGITSVTTTYEYDVTKRYNNKTILPSGQSSLSVVNSLGMVSEDTSALGLKTYYKYDNWGNVREITDYLGKKTTIGRSISTSPPGAAYSITKRSEGGAITITTFDKFDKELQTRNQSINNKWVFTRKEYDVIGRVTRISEPYLTGENTKWNSIEYDALNRPIKNTSFSGVVVNTCYEGMKVTVDDGHKKSSKTLDAQGNVIRAQDQGGVISYKYYPNGALKETNYEGIKTTFEIDNWGNKSKMTDASAGIFEYEYDNLSRITKEITPKGFTKFSYDNLGRLDTEKTYGNTAAENTSIEKKYTYNANTNLLETISGQSNGSQFIYTTYYDDFYRIKGKKEQTPDFTYTTLTTFDSFGRADVATIATTVNNPNHTTISEVKNVYDVNGILIRQNNNLTGQMIWLVTDVDAQGKTKQIQYGNRYTITNNYRDSDNSLAEIRSVNNSTGVSIVDIGFDYDVYKGVLKTRDNRTFGKVEKYTYDKLNRLLTESVNDILVNEYTYDKRGRITSNTELGKYNYDVDNYKLKNINLNTNGQSVNSQRGFAHITYNAYRSPLRITLDGKDDLSFEYNILKTRYRMNSSVTGKQKLYSSDFAIEITKTGSKTEILTFITGDPYSANYLKKDVLINGNISESGNYFLHRDNQGTILAVTKDDNVGTVVEKRYFDAWGNVKAIVNSTGQLINNNVQLQFMDRGYTGHEHMQSVGLINMNARIYDPILRKFLSADSEISDPYNTQSYDRYSYVLNNPLLYIDVDGNEVITLAAVGIAAAIGAAVGVFSKVIINMINGIPFWYGLGKAATSGAISGAVSFGIGSAASSMAASFIGKAAFQAGMHGLSGGVMSSLDGGNFGSGFLAGMISSVISTGIQALGTNFTGSGALQDANRNYISMNSFGSGDLIKATMIVAGGLSGGISSAIAGGKFWQGIKQGIMTSGLNHLAHFTAEALGTVSFKSLDEIKEKYPRLYRVLNKLQEYVSNTGEVSKAFMDNSQMSRNEMLDLLNIDKMQNIPLTVDNIVSKFQSGNGKDYYDRWNVGGKTAGEAPFKITINKLRVLTLERLTNAKAINAYSFAIAITVLHEFVHYARDIQGLDNTKYEYGVNFERQATGVYWPYDENLYKTNKHGWKF